MQVVKHERRRKVSYDLVGLSEKEFAYIRRLVGATTPGVDSFIGIRFSVSWNLYQRLTEAQPKAAGEKRFSLTVHPKE